jgi:hypothetical protein
MYRRETGSDDKTNQQRIDVFEIHFYKRKYRVLCILYFLGVQRYFICVTELILFGICAFYKHSPFFFRDEVEA